MPLFTAYANQLVDNLLRGVGIPQSDAWIGLSSTVPNVDGTNWTELGAADYGGYSRISISSLMSIGASGNGRNNAEVTFPTPLVGGGVVNAWAIFGSPTDSDVRAFFPVQPGLLVVAGRPVLFRVNALGAGIS